VLLRSFDPFAELDRMTREMVPARPRSWMPVDAYKKGDRFVVHLDLPGVDPDSIDIQVEKDTLTVSAERIWTTDEDTTVLLSERPYGTFRRQFVLGDTLDLDRIEAGYDNGVLTLIIPVAEQAKPKKILVGSGDRALAAG
jgi:HSP20 family protein